MPPTTNDEIKAIFTRLDKNGSGYIDYSCKNNITKNLLLLQSIRIIF